MVVRTVWLYGPLAVERGQQVIDRLDGPTKAKVLAALAAFVILGVAMILLTWLGARAAKRYMNSGAVSRSPRINPDDWALKSLIEDERDFVDD